MLKGNSKILDYVSRETAEKYSIYYEMLKKWNRNTSLVQIKTLDDFFERHILDSLQLTKFLDNKKRIIDIGTGAGFPGMVLAIAGIKNITLCDSSSRKTIFLEELRRALSIDVDVICDRVESLKKNNFDFVLSRACTELSNLLNHCISVSRETENVADGIFLKGKNVDAEILQAESRFQFKFDKYNSLTSAEGVILKVYNIQKL